jgi:L-asparagine transporter-like permease
MLIAWLFVSLFLISSQLLTLIRPSEVFGYKPLIISFCVFNGWFIVWLINAIRSGEKKQELSAWGYWWRSYISMVAAIPILLALIYLLRLQINSTSLSLIHLFISNLLYLFTSAVSAWLLFSTDRKKQIQTIFSALRGY